MKNILILGSSCMIGQSCANLFLDKGYTVFKASRNEKKESIYNIKWNIYLDKLDLFVERIPSKLLCLVVLAWHGNSRENKNNQEINNKCSRSLYQLLEYICYRKEVNQIILAGSQAEYGALNGIVDEKRKTDFSNISAYGVAKLWLYEKIKTQNICNIVTELRFNNVYGYYKKNSLIYETVVNALKNEDMFFYSNCCQNVDYLYSDDAAEAVLMAVNKKIEGIYNISALENKTLREYLETILYVTNSSSKLKFGLKKQNSMLFDSSKFRTVTGWKEKINFSLGIRMIVEQIKLSNGGD